MATTRALAQVSPGDYGHPHTLVGFADGRAISLFCVGQGSPTIIFLTGLGLESNSWLRVQGEVAKATRACAFGRPGYGFSDPGPARQDAQRIAADLKATLKAAEITGPTVVVGHSAGGSFARMFANLNLADVAGMVLIAKETRAPEEVVDAQDLACIREISTGDMKPGSPHFAGCGSQRADGPP